MIDYLSTRRKTIAEYVLETFQRALRRWLITPLPLFVYVCVSFPVWKIGHQDCVNWSVETGYRFFVLPFSHAVCSSTAVATVWRWFTTENTALGLGGGAGVGVLWILINAQPPESVPAGEGFVVSRMENYRLHDPFVTARGKQRDMETVMDSPSLQVIWKV